MTSDPRTEYLTGKDRKRLLRCIGNVPKSDLFGIIEDILFKNETYLREKIAQDIEALSEGVITGTEVYDRCARIARGARSTDHAGRRVE